MTWNPYGTGGDDPSTPPGEGLSGSQVPPSSWPAQQGSGYGGHGQSSYDQSDYGHNAYGQSSPGQSSYDPAGASQSDSIPPAAAGAHYVPAPLPAPPRARTVCRSRGCAPWRSSSSSVPWSTWAGTRECGVSRC